MKNIDILWENTEKRFREHFDNKKTVWGGYAISFVSIALAILTVGVTVWRHREFTGETLELTVVWSLLGITCFVFCYFRKTAPIRVKFYTSFPCNGTCPNLHVNLPSRGHITAIPRPRVQPCSWVRGHCLFRRWRSVCIIQRHYVAFETQVKKETFQYIPKNHIKNKKNMCIVRLPKSSGAGLAHS